MKFIKNKGGLAGVGAGTHLHFLDKLFFYD
jgi:hypothetical protein